MSNTISSSNKQLLHLSADKTTREEMDRMKAENLRLNNLVRLLSLDVNDFRAASMK